MDNEKKQESDNAPIPAALFWFKYIDSDHMLWCESVAGSCFECFFTAASLALRMTAIRIRIRMLTETIAAPEGMLKE